MSLLAFPTKKQKQNKCLELFCLEESQAIALREENEPYMLAHFSRDVQSSMRTKHTECSLQASRRSTHACWLTKQAGHNVGEQQTIYWDFSEAE